jgi:hypothetical protein
MIENNGLQLDVATSAQWIVNLRVSSGKDSDADNIRNAIHIPLRIVVDKGVTSCNVSSNILVLITFQEGVDCRPQYRNYIRWCAVFLGVTLLAGLL